MSKICMISFGNLEEPRNGYVLRCWMLAKKLVDDGNEVTVYQFSTKDSITARDGIEIHSIKVRHEQMKSSLLERFIGFQPTRELLFPFEGYFKLRKHRKELLLFDEFYIGSCLLINAIVLVKRLHKNVTIDTVNINKDVALKIQKNSKFIGTIRVAIWHLIENTTLHSADKIITVSELEKQFIERHYHIPAKRIEVISHVVDPAAAEKYYKLSKKLRTRYLSHYKKIACFIGDLGAIHNIEAEKYIREKLAPITPDVHYIFVGNNSKDLESQTNITYTGFVDAVDPYIMMADFCIAPLAIGSGIKTKVLDYLKYDKTILATPVAIEGIDPSRKTVICELDKFSDAVKNQIEAVA